jgi:cytochrome c2
MNAHEHHLAGCLALCAAGIIIAGALAVTLAFTIAPSEDRSSPPGVNGDARRGRTLLAAYGCTACHEANVGPSLDRMGARSYIAGRLPNDPIVMQRWIEHPQSMKPGTAMPDLGVARRDARDITAYLATLR